MRLCVRVLRSGRLHSFDLYGVFNVLTLRGPLDRLGYPEVLYAVRHMLLVNEGPITERKYSGNV